MKVNSALMPSLLLAGNAAAFAPTGGRSPLSSLGSITAPAGRVTGQLTDPDRSATARSLFISAEEGDFEPEGMRLVEEAFTDMAEIMSNLQPLLQLRAAGMSVDDVTDVLDTPFKGALKYVQSHIIDTSPRSDQRCPTQLCKEKHEATLAVRAYLDNIIGDRGSKAELLRQLMSMLTMPLEMAAYELRCPGVSSRGDSSTDDVALSIAYQMLKDIDSTGSNFVKTYAMLEALTDVRRELGDERQLNADYKEFAWVDMPYDDEAGFMGFVREYVTQAPINSPSIEWSALRSDTAIKLITGYGFGSDFQ